MRRLVSRMLVALAFCTTPFAVAQDADIADIVFAQDAYIAEITDETRAGLIAALAAYDDAPTVETVKAHLSIVVDDKAAGNYENMFQSATAARDHLEPVSGLLPQQYSKARYIVAVAQFNRDVNGAAMLEMAHVEGFTRAYRDQTGEQPDWAANLKWKADAWGMAMDAYFESARKRHPGEDVIEQILASYGADTSTMNPAANAYIDESGLPPCSGRMIQKPRMRYPAGKAMRGKFGAVILGMEFDAEGKVINPRVLASVPFEEFDEKSMLTVAKWRFKPDNPKQVGVSCRIQRTDVVQPLVFQIR